MERGTFKDCLEDTLSHLKDEIDLTLNPLSPKTQPMPVIIESLADVLSDPETFDFKVEELQAFLVYLENSKESGVPMAKTPRDQFQSLSKSLAEVTLDTTSTHSAGVGVSDAEDHISLRSTSPRIARWNLLNAQSAYHPLVVRSNSSRGAIQTFAKQVYGGSLDRCTSSFDIYARIDTCLLHIWCHVFDTWLGVKMVEPLYFPDLEESSAKTESKDDIKMSNEEYIKTEFPEIMIRNGPKRQFAGVSIARPKRKRGPSNDSEESKANLSKKVKREIKKEEDTEILIYEPDLPRFQIPPYPSSWPDSIIRRLKAIPPLDPLPTLSEDFMSHTFSRQEFSMKFGGSWVQYDSRWKRKRAALQQIPGLGHTFVVGALLKYNFPPHVPCAPGVLLNTPGLLMPHGVEEPRTVFVWVRPGTWLYVGEYRLQLAKPFAEWDELPNMVKQAHSPQPDVHLKGERRNSGFIRCSALDITKGFSERYALWTPAHLDQILRDRSVTSASLICMK